MTRKGEEEAGFCMDGGVQGLQVAIPHSHQASLISAPRADFML